MSVRTGHFARGTLFDVFCSFAAVEQCSTGLFGLLDLLMMILEQLLVVISNCGVLVCFGVLRPQVLCVWEESMGIVSVLRVHLSHDHDDASFFVHLKKLPVKLGLNGSS